MHMADALISPSVGISMWLLCSLVTKRSIKKLKKDDNKKIVPLMGVLGAFVFASQMINFSIPGTGASGHITGGILLAAILGKYYGFMTLAIVLLIQCLFFADGGILAYGCNLINIGFYACFIAYPFICLPLWKMSRSKIAFMSSTILGSIVSLQLGAFSVVYETSLSNINSLPFSTFILFMLPIHLVIGIVEGFLTGSILLFIREARPNLIVNSSLSMHMPKKKSLAYFCVSACIFAGTFFLLASDNPDGLDWSIKQITGVTKLKNMNSWQETTEKIQNITALLPNYKFANDDKSLGTSFAGVSGGIATCLICIGLGIFFTRGVNKK